MINFLSLKNFKSIKAHAFKLQNLNLVLGLNGMGKSTFIQSLLLLRQSPFLSKGVLRLKGDHTNIGLGRDAYYQFGSEEFIQFDVSFSDGQSADLQFRYRPDADYLETENQTALQKEFFSQSLFQNKFQYLSAIRMEPKQVHEKSFSIVRDAHSVGDMGDFTVHFLSMYGDDKLRFSNLAHPNAASLQLLEQVNAWMGEISPGVKLSVVEIPNSDNMLLDMQFAQPTLGFTNRFKPSNVGFGISYALPIVTAILAAGPESLIIVENPESHIHPRGQAELGRLLALAAMNDIQVIVETHSDHVLNGVRVAARQTDIDPNRIALFYFEKMINEREQYSRITNIQIDRQGELSDYPKNLLEEWGNQLMHLI